MRIVMALALVAACAAAAPAAHAGTVAWRSAQPAPPPGAPFSGPVGAPADMQFLGRSFGLMLVGLGGANVGPFQPGLLVYDGSGWRQLATVCGGPNGRIAIASGQEWWTTAAETLRNGAGPPITACRFVNGAVAASYAVAAGDTANAYTEMTGAACAAPNDCWFGGSITDRPFVGSLLLRWDGASLTRVVHPSARGVSDLQPFGGRVVGGTVVGPQVGEGLTLRADGSCCVTAWESLVASEPDGPRLLRYLGADGSVTVPGWAPRPHGVTQGTTEMIDLADLDEAGGRLWIAGRGTGSAYLVDEEIDVLPVPQRPFLAVMQPGDAEPREIEWADDADIEADEVILDVTGIPGTDEAWLALGKGAGVERPSETRDRASLARVDADGEVLERIDLARPDLSVGDAARLECPAADDCWMVTAGGWIYHWSDPDRPAPVNADAAIQRLITTRPVDARTPRDDPDTLPQSESFTYVAPPAEEEDAPVEAAAPRQVAALFRVIGKPRVRKARGRYTLQVRIQLRRKARVQLVGRRGGRTVARSARRTLNKGRRTVSMRVRPKRWPTSLRFITRDLELQQPAGGGDDAGGGPDDTVTTG
jgi:hypothetical protein